MRVIASVALSSLLVAPSFAGAAGPVEGRFWNGRFESSGAFGELHVSLEAVKSISLTFQGTEQSTEYEGSVLSTEMKDGRVVIHGKLEGHRTSGVKVGKGEPTPFDTGWQPLTGELTITLEGKLLPTDPYKVDVIIGTLKFMGTSPDVPEWLPGTQATAILSSFGQH